MKPKIRSSYPILFKKHILINLIHEFKKVCLGFLSSHHKFFELNLNAALVSI